MNAWKAENLGPESRKAHVRRQREGFFDRYFGGVVLDIGYRGYEEHDVVPVLPDAIGVDLNYPGYDGRALPFEEGSVDTVYASHTLEHIQDPAAAVREWFRVLKPGGYLVVAVPHQFLYEKKAAPPSRWNGDHKRFYTPGRLMAEVEAALAPNSYRVRHLIDDDEEYDYSIPPERHAGGGYQVELVLQKIRRPEWALEKSSSAAVAEEPQARPGLEKPPAALANYLRDGAVSAQDVAGTTRFFRNRAQLRAFLAALRGPRILVAGASRGCEAWSLAMEAERLGIKLEIDAVDLVPGNIELARAARYHRSDLVDFDGTDLLTADAAKFFEIDGDEFRVRTEMLSSSAGFREADLFSVEGKYDGVLCNNVLIHFSDRSARRALHKLAGLLVPGGVLGVGGAPISLVSEFSSEAGLEPVERCLETIWDGWRGDRLAWDRGEGGYVAMPPLDKTLPDWKRRFCTLFMKSGAAMPEELVEGVLTAAWRLEKRLSEDGDAVAAFAALLEAVNGLIEGMASAADARLEEAARRTGTLMAAAGECGVCRTTKEAEAVIKEKVLPELGGLRNLLLRGL